MKLHGFTDGASLLSKFRRPCGGRNPDPVRHDSRLTGVGANLMPRTEFQSLVGARHEVKRGIESYDLDLRTFLRGCFFNED